MEWTTPPVVPASVPVAAPEPTTSSAIPSTGSGIRRAVITAALSALLLVGGAVAVVSAASPDPSAAPLTTATNTTAPAGAPGGTSTQPAPRQHGPGAGCPNAGADDGSGSGSGTAPSSPTTRQAPAATPLTQR